MLTKILHEKQWFLKAVHFGPFLQQESSIFVCKVFKNTWSFENVKIWKLGG